MNEYYSATVDFLGDYKEFLDQYEEQLVELGIDVDREREWISKLEFLLGFIEHGLNQCPQ